MFQRIVMVINSSIKWKLIMTIAVLFIFIISSLGFLSYWSSSKSVQSEVDRISQEIIKQANLNLERYLTSYKQGFLLISSSPEVKSWMSVKPEDKIESYLLFDEIVSTYLQSFIFHNPEIISFSLYNENGLEMTREVKYGVAMHIPLKQIQNEINLQDEVFHMEVRQSSEYRTSQESSNIPILTMVNKFQYSGQIGYVKLDIDLSPTVEIINQIQFGGSGIGLIIDDKGRIIAHPNHNMITTQLDSVMLERLEDKKNGSFYLEDTNDIVLYQSIDKFGWKTVIVIAFDEFSESLIEIRVFVITSAIVAIFVSILLTIWIGTSITNRIRSLRKAIVKTEYKKFQSFVIVEGNDEIADLGKAYNTMLTDLEQYSFELNESKHLQFDAEFSALQSQIDAHFLYNTLESINSMANLSGEKEIELITVSLAKMLRYTSTYHGMIVTLQDEYNHLNNYLTIIQTRFGEDFNYHWDVDQSILSLQCLKVLLQPIVENSVKYGMNGEGQLVVKINIKKVRRVESTLDDILITVEDNGGGFSEEKLKELQTLLELANDKKTHLGTHNHRVGLLNIHSRLRMYYSDDDEAGLTIANMKNSIKGAIVTLKFPYRQ